LEDSGPPVVHLGVLPGWNSSSTVST
jgi:hypothetical protein